LEEERKATG